MQKKEHKEEEATKEDREKEITRKWKYTEEKNEKYDRTSKQTNAPKHFYLFY